MMRKALLKVQWSIKFLKRLSEFPFISMITIYEFIYCYVHLAKKRYYKLPKIVKNISNKYLIFYYNLIYVFIIINFLFYSKFIFSTG